jgi:hypothetical protein
MITHYSILLSYFVVTQGMFLKYIFSQYSSQLSSIHNLPLDVNTSLSSVPDTLHVQKLERHEIGTNLFRKNFHDIIV